MSSTSATKQLKALCQDLNIDSDRVITDLLIYENELIRWQKVKNLVSRETLGEIWSRHFLDSVQLFTLLPQNSQVVLDLGSGGGFPAIPLAVAGRQSGLKVLLVEANGRKCSFLRHLGRKLDLDIEVFDVRAEDLRLEQEIDVFTARGFASLDRTFDYIFPFFGENSHALLQKGRGYKEEIAASLQNWRYDYRQEASIVASDSVILDIVKLKRS